jgi:hypothetical protein
MESKRELRVLTMVKQWVTGNRPESEPADFKYQLELEARKLMNESGVVKPPCHKEKKSEDSYLGMFKRNWWQGHYISLMLEVEIQVPEGDTGVGGTRLRGASAKQSPLA